MIEYVLNYDITESAVAVIVITRAQQLLKPSAKSQ